jgi:Domain of unknown function (DUF6484)
MNANDLPADARAVEPDASELLSPLLHAPRGPGAASASAVVVGELLALADDTRLPIVRCAALLGEESIVARSAVDLHGAHIGQAVVLAFEMGDPARPIVMGLLRGTGAWPLEQPPAQVQVDADGQRIVINAKEQLVLRCGRASITLTKAGKVLIEGSYVLSRSSGMNRIKGGSVQLN